MELGLTKVSIKLVKEDQLGNIKVKSPNDAVKLIQEILQECDREMMCVINLKSDGTPINFNIVSQGTVNYSVAHPREILKSAILSNAAGIILMHNHLGSNVIPSKDDKAITNRMVNVCELMKIPLYDHIITCADSDMVYSFYDEGILPSPNKIDYSSINSNLAYSAKHLIDRVKKEEKTR